MYTIEDVFKFYERLEDELNKKFEEPLTKIVSDIAINQILLLGKDKNLLDEVTLAFRFQDIYKELTKIYPNNVFNYKNMSSKFINDKLIIEMKYSDISNDYNKQNISDFFNKLSKKSKFINFTNGVSKDSEFGLIITNAELTEMFIRILNKYKEFAKALYGALNPRLNLQAESASITFSTEHL